MTRSGRGNRTTGAECSGAHARRVAIGCCAVLVLSAALFVLICPAVASAETTPSFDHDVTRFPLIGKHERVSCQRCHIGGQFSGTPTNCRSCHGSAAARAETRPGPNHIPVQTDCSNCHRPRFWEPARMDHSFVDDRCETCHIGNLASTKSPGHIQSSDRCGDCHGTRRWEGARFDHSSITGNCFTCHNGSTATGKNPGHIASGNDCEICHSTRAWSPAGFDHSSITTNCVTCHNGTTARGKGPNHLQTGDDCELCHSTDRWSPATTFDHSGITANCFSCHNGTTAPGKNVGHLPTGNDCETCHMTNGWLPAGFDHANVMPGTCNSCHNGAIAEGTPTGHFSSTLSCDRCHGTANWLPANFDHAGAAYPGDHRVNLTCTDCHGGNSQIVTWSAPAYQPDCAACHANDYKQEVDDHLNRTVSENRDCSGSGCHSVRDQEF